MKGWNLEQTLQHYFGFTSFREGQKEIIEDILQGNDVLGILPTGTGKSMCYQLPAMMLDGSVLIISPLISLMMDQVKQLKQVGFKRVIAINSFLDPQQKREVYRHLGSYKLIFCSPEMLQNRRFFDEINSKVNVSLFVVDEAHCISQWGHEFRTDYLKLSETLHQLGDPPVLALSATAPNRVQEDIITQLGKRSIRKHIYPMDRENIAFSIEHVSSMEAKLERMKEILTSHPVPTMIYFSSRQWTEKASFELSQSLPHLRIAFYHGGMEQTERILIQQQFMNNQLDVICCTSAFGMGINKANIRLVIHAHLPAQFESFLQEVGRAGRDGEQSVSITFYAPGDSEIPRSFIESELPSETLLNHFFEVLKKKSIQGEWLLNRDELIQDNLQCNEIQWRFLLYQLEKHGMIKNKKVVLFNQALWDRTHYSIKEFIEKRNTMKQQKLVRLLNWVHEEGCLRKRLYQDFQSSIKEPVGYCCDACDFSLQSWQVIPIAPTKQAWNWEQELRKLLLQGE
ncbi:RecQ family ATP-dependent DNA helicase [Pontibacillus litoralis]|uniref:ATP-dependent DNA helicase RecQ n=1 Tax=Pontibacillus litoralis JSM 072002 TaxID=1385512 RepID=A0A0A5G491_9BACI|nr:ATP-dependent DNA helicase RecQ [Pontibacillus litoralis]KGX85948.1 ATP-dependent DNA helicase RecQ [Pontibacillus litoralis JSM 072002]